MLHDLYFSQMVENNLSSSLWKKLSYLPRIILSFWSNYTRVGKVTFFFFGKVTLVSVFSSPSFLPPHIPLPLWLPPFPFSPFLPCFCFLFSFPFPSIHCAPTVFYILLDIEEGKTWMNPLEGIHWPGETNINWTNKHKIARMTRLYKWQMHRL